MRTILALLCALTCIAATPSHSTSTRYAELTRPYASLVKRFHGQLYVDVRPRLMKLGYKPVRLRRPEYGPFCKVDNICERFPETENCSGSGRIAECDFLFIRPGGRGYMFVVTDGERNWVVVDMRSATKMDLRLLADRMRMPVRHGR